MKRTAILVVILSATALATAQTYGQGGQQNPPAATPATQGGQATAPAGQTTPAQTAPGLQAKRPPQAKTQPEFDAWKAADEGSRPTAEEQAALQKNPADTQKIMTAVAERSETAADEFAPKVPESEVRVLLYKPAMRNYHSVNNSDKTEAMGRKVLSFDADDPEALVIVAEVIAERTGESDIDKDQRYDEAMKMAVKATQTVETDTSFNQGTPQEKIDAYKSLLRSNAYSIMGTIDFKKNSFASAQANLQKSIDAYPAEPDPVVVLRLALALDKQDKYPDALKVANRAVELTQESSQIGTLARRERDRLQQLTGSAPVPAKPQAAPPKN
jgi:tetratricopeptide (TPR) repeat protein